MLLKKFYLPIGLCVLFVLAIGFLSLRSDVPDEPIKIYKVTTPAKVTKTAETETATSETATDGKPFHGKTHTEENATEKMNREIVLKTARQEIEIANDKAQTTNANNAVAKLSVAALGAEFEELNAKDTERRKHFARLTEKRKALIDQFSDIREMTTKKYLALSETEQEDFLLRCIEYDLFIEDFQAIIHSMPQWMHDEWNDIQPGYIDAFLNLPSLTEKYGKL